MIFRAPAGARYPLGAMSDYVLPPPLPTGLPVAGDARLFPVHRVFCVGRNYAAHAREMGADPEREPPFFFTKPPEAVVHGPEVAYPPATAELHHEVELVVALGRGGHELDSAAACAAIFGYAVGLDLTRRDLQREAKERRRPWDAAKAFEGSAPCSPLQPAESIGHPERGLIWLQVGEERRQEGDLAQMIWPVPELIARLSALFRLAPGDLVFTGTPSGVGRLERGDRVAAGVEGVGELRLRIV